MTAKTSGSNPTELRDQLHVRNVAARTYTEHQVTEDTAGEAEEWREAEDVDRTSIAIPCVGHASLQAEVSPHFGRCDSYAIVTLEEGRIKSTESVSNEGHSDCVSPVRALAEKGVSLMLVEAMGMRPYLACRGLSFQV